MKKLKLNNKLTVLTILFVTLTSYAELPLDPQRWKITFPISNSEGNALEVLNPKFSDILSGTSELPEDLKKYLSFSADEIVFTTEYTGVTTTSSISYSRTELRQMNGAEQHNWTLDQDRQLECRLKISELQGDANKLFFMQIHGSAPESKPLLKVIWEKGYIRLLAKSGPKLKDFKKQQKYTEIGTDTWFSCAIHASRESLDVYINGEKIESFGSDILKYWPKDNTYYFKAGNYLQHDTEGSGATVTFSSIDLER